MSATECRAQLVTGASGHLGRQVIKLLLEAQAGPIIATTRHPERLGGLAASAGDARGSHNHLLVLQPVERRMP